MEDADDGPLFAKPDSTRASLDMVRIRLPNPSPPKQGSNNRVYNVLSMEATNDNMTGATLDLVNGGAREMC